MVCNRDASSLARHTKVSKVTHLVGEDPDGCIEVVVNSLPGPRLAARDIRLSQAFPVDISQEDPLRFGEVILDRSRQCLAQDTPTLLLVDDDRWIIAATREIPVRQGLGPGSIAADSAIADHRIHHHPESSLLV